MILMWYMPFYVYMCLGVYSLYIKMLNGNNATNTQQANVEHESGVAEDSVWGATDLWK